MRFFNYSLEENLFIKNEIEKVSNFLILNVVNVYISGYLDKEREDFLIDFMSNYIFNIEFGGEGINLFLVIMNFQQGLFPINRYSKEYYYPNSELSFKRKLKIDISV